MASKSVKLEKSADWPTWLSFVRTRPQNDGIWDLINPDVNEKPQNLIESIESTFEHGRDELDKKTFEVYTALLTVHIKAAKKYEKQKIAFKSILKYI